MQLNKLISVAKLNKKKRSKFAQKVQQQIAPSQRNKQTDSSNCENVGQYINRLKTFNF